MKYLLAIIFPCLYCCALYAQQASEDIDGSWKQYLIQLYGDDEEAAVAMDEAYEHLTELAKQPLDINKLETQDFLQIPGLDLNEVNDIVTYRQKYGGFRSIDELAMIASIDDKKRLYLTNFLAVYDKKDVRWYSRQGIKEQFHHLKNEITLTAQIPTYYRAGDINAPEETYLGTNRYAGKYLGDPVKHSVRYTLNIGSNITFNLTGAKTAGESFGGTYNKLGYDNYAFNLDIRQFGVFRQLIIGKFRGQFGMGLIMNNNFYMGKQGMLSSMGRRISVFTPHSSDSDSKHFQGVAATIDIAKHLQLSTFLSYRYIDATLNADSTIATILTTGYHRTTLEMNKKNNSSIFTTGMHIGYERLLWSIGLNAIFSHLDRDINPVYSKADTISSGRLYRKYNPTGNNFWNISVDYRYRWHDLDFSGETATGGCGNIATTNNLTWRSPWNITFMALQRYYAYQYNTLYGRSFGENSSPQNESGIYFGLQWTPRRNFTIDAYTDFAYFPWLKYLISNSSYSWDNSVMATLTHGNWSWSLRYRIKTKQKDKTIDDVKQLVNHTDHRLRLLAQLSNKHWTSRTQLEGCILSFNSNSKGIIVSEGLGYRMEKKFSVNGTVAYFNTDDYDSRLYTYEQGVKYSFGNSSYYGHGMHMSLLAKYQPWQWLIAAAKVAHTRYFDRETIGTAERMIFSSYCTDFDIQLIFRL